MRPEIYHLALPCFVILLGPFLFSQARVVDSTLILKQPRFGEEIGLQDSVRYSLRGLEAGATYEVRVSYPATVRCHHDRYVQIDCSVS